MHGLIDALAGSLRWFCVGFLLLPAVAGGAETELFYRHHLRSGQFGLELEGDGRRYAPDRVVDILHLRLEVTPDFARRTVAGTTRLDFQPISTPCSELRLDAMDLTIQAVRSDRAIADHVNTGRYLVIHFTTPIPVGEKAHVEIDHEAQPVRGLYFRTPEMGYPTGDTQIWTQGESHEARFWFPCFDYPNERSSTEVICHVPADMEVLSNGRKIGESIGANGLKRVHWLQEKPHVNYLICLVAGKFVKFEKEHGRVPLGFYAPPSLADHAANAFADTDQIMAFYESEIGVPFPWEKYDQAALHDFIAGGMENTTLTTLTERTINSSDSENLRSSRQLDAHELAHQWFGDYVTCKDWSQLWLNEGFATYYTHLYEGYKFGPEAMLYGLYQDAQTDVLPQSRDKRAIVYRNYKNTGEQFDYRAYPKGSWVLHMLRSQLGPDLYRDCIRAYLQKHALQSVVSDDLRQVIEERSGRSFDRFFDQWVYHGGCPELKIEFRWDGTTQMAQVTIRQTHEANDGILLFELPTKLRFVVGDEVIDHEILIQDAEHEFHVPLPGQPRIVRFDPEYTLLAKVEFDQPEPMLLAQLAQKDDTLGRVLAAAKLSERKTYESVEALKRALKEDPFFGVRIAASESLRKIGNDEAYQALADSLAQDDARVRHQVTKDLCSFYRPETHKQIVKILEHEKNPGIQAEAIEALSMFQDEAAERQLVEFLQSRSFRNELANAAVQAIAAQRRPELAQPLMAEIERRRDEFTSRGLASALTTLGSISQSAEDKSEVREFLAKFLQDPRSPVRRGAITGLGALKDLSTAGILESLAQTERDEQLAKAAQTALEKLQDQTPLAPREVAELRKQLTELREESKSLKDQLETLQKQFQAMNDKQESDTAATDAPSVTSAERADDGSARESGSAGAGKTETPLTPSTGAPASP